MTEQRGWKHTFDKTPLPPAEREDLSLAQKHWLKRAWEWASTAMLGFATPTIPDAVPRYNEQRGWHHVPAIDPDMNHINPVGESTRLDGVINYNDPRNVVPISRRNHTGKGVHELDAEDEFIVHRDTYEARKKWPWWKKNGNGSQNPMEQLHDEREAATDRGEGYHDTSYDDSFRDLADRVVSGYTAAKPEDKWPTHPKDKKRRQKVWSESLMQWVDRE